MRFSRRVFSLLAATQRCSKTPWRSLRTVQLTKWWEHLSTTKHIRCRNNNNLWNRHGNTTTDLESFRATSSIEFILSILARNDNRSERREDTKSRSWRNSSCKAYVRTRVQMHNLKMMRTSNCFTLKLSSEQHWCIKELNDTLWELSSASARNLLALLQRLYYYYYCNNKHRRATKFLTKKTAPVSLRQIQDRQKGRVNDDWKCDPKGRVPHECDYPRKSWAMPDIKAWIKRCVCAEYWTWVDPSWVRRAALSFIRELTLECL